LLKTSTISGIRSGLYLALQNGETDKEIRGPFLVKAVLFQPPVALAQVFEFMGAWPPKSRAKRGRTAAPAV
jgi:hypothetical protein